MVLLTWVVPMEYLVIFQIPDYFGPDSMEYVLMDNGTTAGQSDPLSDTALIVINTLLLTMIRS